MRTDELVTMLARGAGAAPRAPAAARIAPALLAGGVAALALSLSMRSAVPAALLAAPGMLLKIGYALALAVGGGWLAARLGRPLARTVAPMRVLAATLALIVLLGSAVVALAPDGQRLAQVLGESWRTCARDVLLVSLPALAGALWALRGLAPTRPRAAGAAAGLAGGAVGAVAYAFTCPELSAAFVAVWYTLGVGAAAALGALLGPRLLHW